MYAKVNSAIVKGIDAFPVTVECDIDRGMPEMTIIGMADVSVIEARARVRCAIKAAGFEIPQGRIVINLAPNSIKKSGTMLDLAIAAAILVASKQIPEIPDNVVTIGELELDGSVIRPRGTTAVSAYVSEHDMRISCAHHITDLRDLPTGDPGIIPGRPEGDFADLVGYEFLKRAIMVAAAGNHGLLMVGNDRGVMATAAKLIQTILPHPTEREQWDIAKANSAAGVEGIPMVPFRMPHHSATMACMIGGGRTVMPGEVTLSNHGVLYLEDVDEFSPNVLYALRQPIDEKRVRIVRTDGSYDMPADFMLVASAKPCPCGHLGDQNITCTCSPTSIMRYQQRMCGPIKDKLTIRANVVRKNDTTSMTSDEMRRAIESAREFRDNHPCMTLDKGALGLLSEYHDMYGTNIRAMTDVATTIAALDGSADVTERHMAEAIFRRND